MFKLKMSQLYKLNRALCLFIRKHTTINQKNPKLLKDTKQNQPPTHQTKRSYKTQNPPQKN